MTRWVLVQGSRYAWYRFWRDADRLPGTVWRRWTQTLLVGFLLCAAIAFAITYWTRLQVEQGWLQEWDAHTLPVLAEALPLTFPRAITWESPGNSIGALPVAITFIAVMAVRGRPLLVATMAAGYGLQFALVWIGWGYWNRSRPDLIADGIAASGLHSFPSGHTVVVLTVYGLLAYLWFQASQSLSERLLIGGLACFWIGMIVISRLELGAHWPSDVVAGLIIGGLWLTTLIVTLRRTTAKF
ncbi:phosphatidic acid phosphatase [filamentous cyanobacterium CCP5]|nr:phosphatidic acid phosphatase [filamentous cyanobacterium CCP5]